MADKPKLKGPLDIKPKFPLSRRQEDDATRPLPREEGGDTREIQVKGGEKKSARESTSPIVRKAGVKPTEREKTTELDIMDVEVVADESDVKGEPTRKTKPPPPHPKPEPKLPDPFTEPPEGDLFEPPDVLQPPSVEPATSDPLLAPSAVDPFESPGTLEPPASWQDDEIDPDEWSTNPVKRLLKKFKK